MHEKPLPVVSDNLLHVLDRGANERTPVVVGSERWYTWLADEQNRSFSFRNSLGTFTVRRERKLHGWYWYVYRKSGGKLRKAYLGKAEEVTLERLSAVAATLLDKPASDDDLDEYAPESDKPALHGHATPTIVNTHILAAPLTPLIGPPTGGGNHLCAAPADTGTPPGPHGSRRYWQNADGAPDSD
jgi:hypothetical protein